MSTIRTQPRPQVSIGMPVHNGQAHLAEAIDSILAQTFRNFELIISDNASSDQTQEICRAYAARDDRIIYVRNERNIGAAPNFNRLVELARGDYFRWAAHDDLLEPTLLERGVRTLDAAPDCVAMCFPRRRFITHDGRPASNGGVDGSDYEPLKSYHQLKFSQLLRLPGWVIPMILFGMIRTPVLRRTRLLGAYRAADVVLIAELLMLGELWELPEVLYTQRLHDETEQWRQRLNAHGEAVWLDPQNAGRPVRPSMRLFKEQMRAIWQAPISPHRKAARYADMGLLVASKVVGLVRRQAMRTRLPGPINSPPQMHSA